MSLPCLSLLRSPGLAAAVSRHQLVVSRLAGTASSDSPLDSSLLRVEQTSSPQPKPPSEGLVFGRHFTDHMLTVRWESGRGWGTPTIQPFGTIAMHPASKVLHYAQEIFEGMKAYRGTDGKIRLFRPTLNMARMNMSARRAHLPSFPSSELLECIRQLILLDQSWVPASPSSSLYIRPAMMGTEGTLGLGPSSQALLMVLLSPVSSYFTPGQKARPVSLLADPRHVRAFPGGCGYAKMGSNYAPTLSIQQAAQEEGCDQVLWLQGEHLDITEVGAMNIFLLLRQGPSSLTLVTPSLDAGTVLPGIIRRSVLELAAAVPGLTVEERSITLPEVLEAQSSGRLLEMFGTGTAATVTSVASLRCEGVDYPVPVPDQGLASSLLQRLQDICYGREAHPWAVEVGEESGKIPGEELATRAVEG